ALKADLAKHDVQLVLRKGAALDAIRNIVRDVQPASMTWSRRYGAVEQDCDAAVKAWLKAENIEVKSFAGNLLHEPWQIKNKSGTHFKVFTPYWNAARPHCVRALLKIPKMKGASFKLKSDKLDDWALHPHKPDWARGLAMRFAPGEQGA